MSLLERTSLLFDVWCVLLDGRGAWRLPFSGRWCVRASRRHWRRFRSGRANQACFCNLDMSGRCGRTGCKRVLPRHTAFVYAVRERDSGRADRHIWIDTLDGKRAQDRKGRQTQQSCSMVPRDHVRAVSPAHRSTPCRMACKDSRSRDTPQHAHASAIGRPRLARRKRAREIMANGGPMCCSQIQEDSV